MALFLLQPGIQPLGHFDFLDTDLANVLGGELAVLDETSSRANSATEKAAYDVLDGYVADITGDSYSDSIQQVATRTVARLADGYSTAFTDTHVSGQNIYVEPYKVFYLTDDGTKHYGTLFGKLVGAPAGLLTDDGTELGPHTAQASGKITLWDKVGLYAVSDDAVATDLNPNAGNLNDTPLPGTTLYREHNTGKITSSALSGDDVAVFIELRDNGSLVNTPGRLVSATQKYDRLVIQYLGATHKIN